MNIMSDMYPLKALIYNTLSASQVSIAYSATNVKVSWLLWLGCNVDIVVSFFLDFS